MYQPGASAVAAGIVYGVPWVTEAQPGWDGQNAARLGFLSDSAICARLQLLHSGWRRITLLGVALLLAAGVPAGAPWRSVTIKDPVRGEIGQVAATEGAIKYRGGLQRALLIVECAEGQTALSLTTADMYFGSGRSQVQWSIDDSKLEGTPWSTCAFGDCLSLRGERAIAIARSLMAALELRLIIDRGFGVAIDASFDVRDGKMAIAAVGRRCGWLGDEKPAGPD